MEPLAPEYEGPRGATPREFGEILDFVNYVFRAHQGRRPSMGGDYPHVYHEHNADCFRHIRHNGRVVSCVNIYPATMQWGDAKLKVGGIGGVATDPEYRKGGLAGRNLLDALDYMEREDYDISILWTGIGDFYRKYGWEDAGTSWAFDVTRTTIRYLPEAPTGEILTDCTDDRVIDGVMELRKSEPRGLVWDRELAKTMLGMRTRHKVALLVVDGKPTAYIIYSYGDRVDVKEHGGDPESVLGMMRVVFGEQGARSGEISTPVDDKKVAPLLMKRGHPARIWSQGMIAVFNPARIVGQYGITDLAFERTFSKDGQRDGWNVTYDGKTVQFSPLDLTKLLFGPERPGGIDHPKLPLPFYYPDVDHM